MIKLTKTELRGQQTRLGQLQKYLPTLQLKKMLLQTEVNMADQEIAELHVQFKEAEQKVLGYSKLLSDKNATDLFPAVKLAEVKKKYENIAGVDIPILEQVVFQDSSYYLFDAPVWLDSAIQGLQGLIFIREGIRVAEEKKEALERELRDVSIRVNLFEKVLIPRALENIKKIKIFLGDQQLAAVCQAKVSKRKLLVRS